MSWCSGRRSAGLPCRCGLSSTARTSCCASSRCSRTWRRGGSGFMSPIRRSSISCGIFPGPIMTMGRMRSKCFGVWHPPDSSAWATPTSGCRWKGSGAMTGRMEDGEGGGAPSEEGFPSQTCWRGSRPLSPRSLSAGGEAARWEYRWIGMGQGAAGFYGERSCSIKAVNRQTGLRALRAESTRRLWGRWRHS